MATHPAPSHLGSIDLAIVAAYLVGITLFGLRFREKKIARLPGNEATPQPDRSLKSYFLANNTIPWWAIALSIVSAETSTLTIISIPGVAFAGDFGFLQIVLGYMLGRIVVALLFLPRYFAGEMLTAYQLIDQRFGYTLHKVTAALFLLTRAAAEGVRVFAVSIVVGIAIGTGDTLSIGIISLLTLLYTFEGGMAAVIWTDVVQMAIYVAGTLVAVWSIGHHVGFGSSIDGWSHIYSLGAAAGKFHLFDFALNLTTTYTFWAGVLGGTFLTMASHGTDQLMVQRMLSARSLRESRLALLSSGVVIFIQFTLFLLIGVGLWVFYGDGKTFHPPSFTAVGSPLYGLTPDRIFPTFIVHELPLGIAGLLVAAILAAAMSNLSAALNSLSSTTVVDFYMQLRPTAADRERNLIAKSSTGLWAIVLFAIAVATVSVGGKGHVVEIALSIASVAYGCLLGVFLLGTLTKFATEIGTAIGMLCGFILNIALWQFPGKELWTSSIRMGDGTTRPGPFSLTIPHIAFTWYVLIGALVTFAIGALASLIFRKQSKRIATTAAAALLLLLTTSTCHPEQREGPATPEAPQTRVISTGASRLHAMRNGETPVFVAAQPPGAPSVPLHGTGGYDFTPITTLLNDAIAAHKLPGAVVLIGHNNKIVFEKAYGNRKLAGEPGLTGQPTEAEPMTVDTIFDMASLTKCLATATAVMQLYEAGKIHSFDDLVETYLPAFNESHDPTRAKVTLRMLLTHTSGEAPDVDLRDPWGLAAPDRTEGLHRALTTPLKAAPGSIFTYSDINFILLGDLAETVSGQPEDVYVADHIFKPLGMSATGYHSFFRACDWISNKVGSAIEYKQDPPSRPTPCQSSSSGSSTTTVPPGAVLGCGVSSSMSRGCGGGPGAWSPVTNFNTAPTAHDNEGTAATNPDFDHLLRGTVHDPTTRRMGGVAGHAGVFSTAHDIGLYAAALLQKLRDNNGPFPLKQSTLQLMTQPEQPSTTGSTAFNSDLFTASQLRAANQAQAYAIADGTKPAAPGLAPNYPAMKGVNLRGYGWDIDTAFSKPRGAIFPIGSFGHTGFTGTSLWMDPASDTYVILLANAIHPRGNPPISNLRGQLATAAAKALGLAEIAYQPKDCDGKPDGPPVTVEQAAATELYCRTSGATDCPGVLVCASSSTLPITESHSSAPVIPTTQPHPNFVISTEAKRSGETPVLVAALQPMAAASRYPEPGILTLQPEVSSGHIPTKGTVSAPPEQGLVKGTASAAPQSTRSRSGLQPAEKALQNEGASAPEKTLTGIDVLESTHFAALHCPTGQLATGKLATGSQPPSSNLTPSNLTPLQDQPSSTCHKNLGILTNQTGLDSHGHRTIDVLYSLLPTPYSLTTIFTPEHGLTGTLDREGIASSTDTSTHLPVISLYGKPSDRRPTHDQLKNLDAVLVDLQDAGVHFWTYEAATGYFLEAAALEKSQYQHDLEIIILDRPNPVGGVAVQGPVSDPGTESYINYMPLPIRHGLTLGELMRYANATKHLDAHLTVIPMQHWSRTQFYADTGLPWINPSPNLRSPEAALRYPALGLIEYTNLSVGRGTDHPFSFFGAGSSSGLQPAGKTLQGGGASAPVGIWFKAAEVATYLTARNIPGVTFTPTTETIAEDANHYPFHGQTIEAVRLTLTDPTIADTPEIGIEILSALHHLYPTQFNLARAMPLVCNKATMDALTRGDDPRSIAATWQPSLVAFRTATKPYLLY